jgi:hypothetical protein
MKFGSKVAIALALVAFAAFVVWLSIPRAPHICEVCLTFGDELVCREGVAEVAEDAARAAQESACGGNVSGMTELIACRNATPVQSRCWLRGEDPPPFSPGEPVPAVPRTPDDRP